MEKLFFDLRTAGMIFCFEFHTGEPIVFRASDAVDALLFVKRSAPKNARGMVKTIKQWQGGRTIGNFKRISQKQFKECVSWNTEALLLSNQIF